MQLSAYSFINHQVYTKPILLGIYLYFVAPVRPNIMVRVFPCLLPHSDNDPKGSRSLYYLLP